jgi:hypothetical protein
MKLKQITENIIGYHGTPRKFDAFADDALSQMKLDVFMEQPGQKVALFLSTDARTAPIMDQFLEGL